MPVKRRLAREEEEGWAVVTAIVLTSLMLVMGLALLAIVDTQAHQSGRERVGDAAFNLAEGALNAESFPHLAQLAEHRADHLHVQHDHLRQRGSDDLDARAEHPGQDLLGDRLHQCSGHLEDQRLR